MFRGKRYGIVAQWHNTARPFSPSKDAHLLVRSRLHLETLEERSLPSFLAPSNYLIGGSQGPAIVGPLVAGDFTGTGTIDLATLGGTSDTLTVLMGNGDGTFQSPRTEQFDRPLYLAAAVGDLNGDGNLDIVAISDQNSVVVLSGNGDGTFRETGSYTTDAGPTSLAVGDLLGNGRLDIVVGCGGSDGTGSISVLLNNGDGTFQNAPSLAVHAGGVPNVTLADMNNDNALDLIYVSNVNSAGQVGVALGNGDGTFQAPVTYETGPQSEAVAVGDLNGDGQPDLVVTNSAYIGGGMGSLSIVLGNGDGTFQTPQSIAAGLNPWAVALGDFSGNSHLDIVVTQRFGNNFDLLAGNGDGTFGAPQSYVVGASPLSVVADDFNGDGQLDVATGNILDVSVRLNQVAGTFPTIPISDTSLTAAARTMVVGDFNGDGTPDLVVASSFSTSLSVLLGNGDGTFYTSWTETFSGTVQSFAVGDFTGNGKLDIIVTTAASRQIPASVVILLGNGDGTFPSGLGIGLSAASPGPVAVGDLNGDGHLDLVVANFASRGTVSVFLGNGDGTFQSPQSYTTPEPAVAVALADFNGDHVPDIVTANQLNITSPSVSVFLGNGDGTFGSARTTPLVDAPVALATGDFNGDGQTDLVLTNVAGSPGGGLTVLLGNGDGTFQSPVTYFSGSQITGPVAVADFNGDQRLDLVTTLVNRPVVLFGNGDGTFQFPNVDYGGAISSLAVADFDGNGYPDIAVGDSASNTVSVILNDGMGGGGSPHGAPGTTGKHQVFNSNPAVNSLHGLVAASHALAVSNTPQHVPPNTAVNAAYAPGMRPFADDYSANALVDRSQRLRFQKSLRHGSPSALSISIDLPAEGLRDLLS